MRQAPRDLPSSSLALLFAVQCVLSIGNSGMFSAMPSIGRAIGIPDAAVTGIFSLSALLWVLCSAFWARMCDRYGQRSLVLVGLAGFVISMGSAGAVINLALAGHYAPWAAFALLLIARSIFGGFGSAAGPASQAYAIERTTEAQRTRMISTFAGATTAGTLVGPLLTPLAIAVWGPAMPFYLFAGIATIAIGAVAVILDSNTPRRLSRQPSATVDDRRSIWGDPMIRPYLLFALIATMAQTAQAQTLGFLVIDVLGRPPVAAQPAVALAIAFGALAALAGQVALVWLRVRAAGILMGAAVLTALSGATLAYAESYPVIFCAFVAQSFGFGLARPAFVATASLAARAQDQARVAGAFASINGFAMLVAPLFILIYGFDRRLPFLLAALAMIGVGLRATGFRSRGSV